MPKMTKNEATTLIAPLWFLGAISVRYTGIILENMPGEMINQELVYITLNTPLEIREYLYRSQDNL